MLIRFRRDSTKFMFIEKGCKCLKVLKGKALRSRCINLAKNNLVGSWEGPMSLLHIKWEGSSKTK
jgi:hypothetical protein